jgi:sigma-B regulation protein RsbU (phosphoserine phosphatase)
MKRQIELSYRTLREKEALERELGIAREVQQLLLPRTVPAVDGMELAGVCNAAVGVGGDYYDYLPLNETQIGLVIADVSGKGIPAALLMAGLQAAVRSLCRPFPRPGSLNGRLNEHLFETSSQARYATMFLGFLDIPTRTLKYSNAGHLPPLLLRGDEVIKLTEGGMPIGLFGETSYAEGQVELRSGDLLALFTDGVIESPDASGEEFGDAQLIELLRKHRGRELDDVVQNVLGELERWTSGTTTHDDVTLLLARAR